MSIALLILAAATLLAVIVLLFRKPAAPPQDPRLLQLAESLPAQLTRVDARAEALDASTRNALDAIRRELSVESAATREANASASAALRAEIAASITSLGQTLQSGLGGFREDNKSSAAALAQSVHSQLEALSQRLTTFTAESTGQHTALRESLHTRLNELMTSNTAHQERLRASVEERLNKLNTDNDAKLEQMRQTVDEKLHSTLQSRLTESFGQVTTHLGEVQKGLGEMKELATGVSDLKKVFSNVKSRGGVGEFLLGQQLEQMFSPEQYLRNARIRPNTQETVEYALKFPAGDGESHTLLPIDAKFPREDWERLEHAYEQGSTEEIATASKAFDRAIRTQGKKIHDLYIDPPTTLPHAIMFLPTENLYAEVVRRPGLQAEIQSTCNVTIAGPSTFMAILTSFQMGFHTLAIQKKGDEVWRVLAKAKGEFEKFGGLMDKVEKQVGTVQTTLREINSKTTTINRALKNVASLDTLQAAPQPNGSLPGFDSSSAIAPLLAASADEE